MMRPIAISVLAVLACGTPALADTHKFVPSAKGSQTYAVRDPVLRIKSGDVVETNALFSDREDQQFFG